MISASAARSGASRASRSAGRRVASRVRRRHLHDHQPRPLRHLDQRPIINQPQVAILCTDGIRNRPDVAETPGADDEVAVHPVGNLSLSFDHRAFDGAYAARFIWPHQADSRGWRLDADGRLRPFERQISRQTLGARLGANNDSHQATSGHGQLPLMHLDRLPSDTGQRAAIVYRAVHARLRCPLVRKVAAGRVRARRCRSRKRSRSRRPAATGHQIPSARAITPNRATSCEA